MIGSRFMGNENEPGKRLPLAQPSKGLQHYCLVRCPARPGNQRWGASPQLKQGVVRGHGPNSLFHTVETRIAEDTDAVCGDTKTLESQAVIGGNRTGCGYGPVAGLEQLPRRPAKPPTTRTYRSGHQSHLRATGCCPGGQFWPYIQFGKDEEIGLQGLEQAIDAPGQVVRQIVCDVSLDPAGQPLRGWTEMRVDDLAFGADAPERLKHAVRLQALPHRGSMKPDQRATSLPVPAGPIQQPIPCSCAGEMARPELGVDDAERRRNRRTEPNRGPVPPGGGGHGAML